VATEIAAVQRRTLTRFCSPVRFHKWDSVDASATAFWGRSLVDEELWVRRAQRGEAGALTYLFEANFDRVYRYAYVRLQDHDEAEDVTQQVFERMLETIKRYEQRGAPFASWLFRIAHNLIVDQARRTRSGERAAEAVWATSVPTNPEDDALVRLEASEVRRLMRQLNDPQRQVLELRFAAQLNVAETAAAMQRSIDAVKSLQWSALKALRALMLAGGEGVARAGARGVQP
jgi:RNA polymerase sigma-70 factor (ECF subfamily)